MTHRMRRKTLFHLGSAKSTYSNIPEIMKDFLKLRGGEFHL